MYEWDISGGFNDPLPWIFTIQEGPSPDGPWNDVSQPLRTVFRWSDKTHRTLNKSSVLYFRVALSTSSGSCQSPVIQPYGDMGRREFLLARDIMRRSVLSSKGLTGVENDVWISSTFGPKCTYCIDPVSGMIRDSHCQHCFGTGRLPPYHGPYDMWMDFSEDSEHDTDVKDQNTGTSELRSFNVTAVGTPVLKRNDILFDRKSGKMYYVLKASSVSEIRRVPILQRLNVREAPMTDSVYTLK